MRSRKNVSRQFWKTLFDGLVEQVNEDDFRADLVDEIGVAPVWVLEAFTDPHASVRQSMQRLHLSPFVRHKDHIRGFVYCVTTGLLEEVHPVR